MKLDLLLIRKEVNNIAFQVQGSKNLNNISLDLLYLRLEKIKQLILSDLERTKP